MYVCAYVHCVCMLYVLVCVNVYMCMCICLYTYRCLLVCTHVCKVHFSFYMHVSTDELCVLRTL